jgi:hypothetical protein
MTTTSTATQSAFDAGVAAANTAIALLKQSMTTEQVRQIAAHSVIPARARNTDAYDDGCSFGWSLYLEALRKPRRRAAQVRHFANR